MRNYAKKQVIEYHGMLWVFDKLGLVSAIDPAEFGFKSHSRNPLIFGLFERIDMVEQIGSGISRIREVMKESHLPAPVFKTEGMFTLVLTRSIKSKQTGELRNTRVEIENARVENEGTRVEVKESTRGKIIELIKEDKTIAASELAKKLGITIKGVEYHLNRLNNGGVIKHIGPTKAGVWEILKEE